MRSVDKLAAGFLLMTVGALAIPPIDLRIGNKDVAGIRSRFHFALSTVEHLKGKGFPCYSLVGEGMSGISCINRDGETIAADLKADGNLELSLHEADDTISICVFDNRNRLVEAEMKFADQFKPSLLNSHSDNRTISTRKMYRYPLSASESSCKKIARGVLQLVNQIQELGVEKRPIA